MMQAALQSLIHRPEHPCIAVAYFFWANNEFAATKHHSFLPFPNAPLIDNNVGSTSFLDELVYKNNNFYKIFIVLL